jgi:hypothetical protein
VRSNPTDWKNDSSGAVAFNVSIHSKFNEGCLGLAKLAAIIKMMSVSTEQKKRILFCEYSHLNTLSMLHDNNLDKALAACQRDARNLKLRFLPFSQGIEMIDWQDAVRARPEYELAKKKVFNLANTDAGFIEAIQADIEDSYTVERAARYGDKAKYLELARLDLLEQCIGRLVVAASGYIYELYPGKSSRASQYVLKYFDERLQRINIRVNVLSDQTGTLE